MTDTRLEAVDRLGLMATGVCAVHCALTPLLVSILPMIGLGALLNPQIEWVLVGLALALGAGTIVPAYRHHHHRIAPLVLFGIGAVCLVGAHTVVLHGSVAEIPTAFLGAVGLTSAQIVNARLRHTCPCDHGLHEHPGGAHAPHADHVDKGHPTHHDHEGHDHLDLSHDRHA